MNLTLPLLVDGIALLEFGEADPLYKLASTQRKLTSYPSVYTIAGFVSSYLVQPASGAVSLSPTAAAYVLVCTEKNNTPTKITIISFEAILFHCFTKPISFNMYASSLH
ncbi:hypothetical protein D3C73_1053740 [compost metagenome]